jgi:hypothetical protein
VKGFNLVPNPPANITAFIFFLSNLLFIKNVHLSLFIY